MKGVLRQRLVIASLCGIGICVALLLIADYYFYVKVSGLSDQLWRSILIGDCTPSSSNGTESNWEGVSITKGQLENLRYAIRVSPFEWLG